MSQNQPNKQQNKTKPENREELPGGPRSFEKKEPPPHTRNAAVSGKAERNTPRSKR